MHSLALPAAQVDAPELKGHDDVAHVSSVRSSVGRDRDQSSPIAPFVLGTVIGGLAGAILGTALSPLTRGLLIGLYQFFSRKLSSAERDQLRFELLLQ